LANSATAPRNSAGAAAAEAEELRLRVEQLESISRAAMTQLFRYRQLFEQAPEPHLNTDRRGVILEVNRAATALFRCPREFLLDKPLPLFVAGPDQGQFYGWLARLRTQQPAVTDWEMQLQVRKAELVTVAVTVAALVQDEQLVGLHWVLRDLAARKRMEQQLQHAQWQVVQMERLAAIGEMAAGLAHESRNAVQRSNACLARLRWRLEGQPEALDLVGRIQQAQDDLLRLYEDVREFAAPICPRRDLCSVGEVWRATWREVTALRGGQTARLEEQVEGGDLVCLVDRFRIGQVFRNLFDNALAACAGGGRVAVHCREQAANGRSWLRVAVRDNGSGFAGNPKGRLFEPFYTTKTHGTGLGLAIVKRIVEAHGGQVSAGDAPGGGAEIVFTLPRGMP
jgi:PAS domain S-box-containing protein